MKKTKTTSLDNHSVGAENATTGEKGNIVIFTDDKGNTELRADVEGETIWATQAQMSRLFEVDIRTINEHLKNVFESKELSQFSVIRKFRITAKDGKRYMVNFYNLDAIIAVGYRVNSKKATQFRIWATKILRDYLVNGYIINSQQIVECPEKIEGLREAIKLIQSDENPGKLKGKITIRLTKDMKAKSD